MKRKIENRINDVAKNIVLVALPLYIGLHLLSHNGAFDSLRTKEASKYLDSSKDATKTVASVDETWKDNKIYTLTMDGYNPQVKRVVSFEDGSKTTLRYRTLAWQPFRKWIKGEEFNPKTGEEYRVAMDNTLLGRVD